MLGDNVVAATLLVLEVCGLQGFGDISKIGLPMFLELWLGTYP